MTLRDRVNNYVLATGFPKSIDIGADGRIWGMWMMGNCWGKSIKYYGSYPGSYLKRVKALFPDRNRVLHVFSGKVDLKILNGDTVDLNEEVNPTYLDDAQELSGVPVENYDLILADPPYSIEDAEHYVPSMVNRKKVMAALGRKAKSGTYVVWLDQICPQYKGEQWRLEGMIGIFKGNNNRFRVAVIFCRK